MLYKDMHISWAIWKTGVEQATPILGFLNFRILVGVQYLLHIKVINVPLKLIEIF